MSEHDHSHSKSDLLLADAGFDAIECRLLKIARFFLVAYTKPQTQAWELAFDMGCTGFGESLGPHVSMEIVNVLRAMRESRKTTFHFNNPACPKCAERVTDCERHLVRTIKAVRSRRVADARMESLILCEGFDTEPLLEAVVRLVALLQSFDLATASTSARTNDNISHHRTHS